ELIGVTSFCRFWGFGEKAYNALLYFFRYSSWSTEMLIFQWITFVLSQNETIMIKGRAVLLGDHTYVPKDGRRMPGVVTLHQHSETQSKPSYFRGHCWGAIGLLIGSFKAPFCIPLHLSIHQGTVHIGQKNKIEKNRSVLSTGIVNMAIDFALKHDLPSVLILDAFFPIAAVFRLATSVYSVEIQQPLISLIIRAKKNYVAYCDPISDGSKKPGRPRKYGMKVKVMEVFDHPDMFTKQQCIIYGKIEEVSVTALNLLWRPTGSLIRFVFAATSHGRIVLMCSDLNQDPISAIELYCFRIRIETMFDMLKNVIGAFNYRFWSKLMPRHSRKPVKNKELKQPSPRNIHKVKRCWEAYERFVMLGAISLGILQMIALKYTNLVWGQFDAYLRTRSRDLPSERTVKYVITRLLITNIFILAPNGIIQEIKERFSGKKEQNKRGSPPHKQNDDIAA
ncbi:hypothetical protein QUF76_16380, partial [Desulfobacterales bacterium HSG16]|nr:hypothetical protein [Desulfobacterales bacterium HSG16]